MDYTRGFAAPGPMLSPPLLVLLLAAAAALAAAWGPGHHLEFSERVVRRRRELLGGPVATLLGEEREAYFYGSIAADIINFKAYGGAYNHCHRWGIVAEMQELAESPRQEAFLLGYLSHLAADTIAHNHYVPYHLARYARTKGLGHLYWEMMADRYIPEDRWGVIAELKNLDALYELDDLVNRSVPKKALPMPANKLIFNHVLLVSERDAWRRGMQRLRPLEKVGLKKGFLAMFQRAAVERVRLALRPGGLERLEHVDPNGKAAQKHALTLRKNLLHRFVPATMPNGQSEELAAPFLEGMQSPPPR